MIGVSVDTRMVVVLGHGPFDVDPVACVERALERHATLVILNVGVDFSDAQRRFVRVAIDHAFEARVHLDALLVPRAKGLAALIARGEDVLVAASGAERRRIDRVLGVPAKRILVQFPAVPRTVPASSDA